MLYKCSPSKFTLIKAFLAQKKVIIPLSQLFVQASQFPMNNVKFNFEAKMVLKSYLEVRYELLTTLNEFPIENKAYLYIFSRKSEK